MTTDETRLRALLTRAVPDAPGSVADAAPIARAAHRRRRRGRVGGVALAVVLVAATLGAVALVGGHGGERPQVAGLPAADPGWRWVTWRDAAVEVPEAWGEGFEPNSGWCANDHTEPTTRPAPYVARNPHADLVFSIGCGRGQGQRPWPAVFGEAPEGFWTPHVSFDDPALDATAPIGTTTYDGWTSTVVDVGAARVRVLGDAGSAGTVRRVLTSARTTTVDAHGCPTTSPAQARGSGRPTTAGLTTVTVPDGGAVCQYALGAGSPGLLAGRTLDRAQAGRLLEGLRQAPAGGGPDHPADCSPDMGASVIVVRLDAGVDRAPAEVWVRYDSCVGNGTDDGTTRRSLTAQTCAPLFADAVRLPAFSEADHDACATPPAAR